MTRTPDEIKKGMECCVIGPSAHQPKCGECPYKHTPMCSDTCLKDALALIKKLQAENAEKDARIQQLEAERDAAVEDLQMGVCCGTCAHDATDANEQLCATCACSATFGNWEWRGVQKD